MFQELVLKDADASLGAELDRLIETVPETETENRSKFIHEMHGFHNIFKRYLGSTSDAFEWDKIKILPEGYAKTYDELPSITDNESIRKQLNELVVVKLNGGLGTTMGCTGPKSLIPVRNDLTFLDLTVQQIESLNKKHSINIPLVLMNSFNTNADTEKVLRKYQLVNVEILAFMQSMYPRLNRESLLPLAKKASCSYKEDMSNWYPPGHGDFYRSFVASGLAEKLVTQGKKWMFLSNIDNLGATVDISILNFLLTAPSQPKFMMEVTDKTIADVKGGTLISYEDRLRLLELAQVPSDHTDEFSSVRTFRIFNTNNLWVHLPSLIDLVEKEQLLMEVIVNPKTLDTGLNILQLEEAAGAAIRSFTSATAVNVPRSRFLPVKTTSDLLAVMSNLYVLDNGHLSLSPLRSFPNVPLIKLGQQFKKVKDFLSRFATIPDLLELSHLTVSGDVSFGRDIILKGTVIIIANAGSSINLPPGSIMENKIVSGNLRILDH